MAKIELLKQAYKTGRFNFKQAMLLTLSVAFAKNLGLVWATKVAPAFPKIEGVIIA
jgi:hypothetical protein